MQAKFSKKNSFVKLITFISVLWGGVLLCIVNTSCENFLKGENVRNEIEQAIAYNNAPERRVLVSAEEGTGSTLPYGNYSAKEGYPFEVSFTENSEYCFLGWKAVYTDKQKTSDPVSDKLVIIEDSKSIVTKITVKSSEGIRILPVCVKRIAVQGEPGPKYDPNGVSRDRSITVEFSKKPSESSFIFSENEVPSGASFVRDDKNRIWAYVLEGQTFFKNISITNSDGYSLANHFLQPKLDGTLLTIAVDKSNQIEFETGVLFKTINVTLGSGICDEEYKVSMSQEKTWRYQITEATDDKATVILTCEQGSIALGGIAKEYSISQKINLSYTEDSEYQFIKWVYDNTIVHLDDETSLSTYAVVIDKTPDSVVSEIKAVCAPRLRVTSYSPVTTTSNSESTKSTVPKNSSIVISFNHKLPDDVQNKAQLDNISITAGGANIKSSFFEPVINENTITFAADKSNMLDVRANQTKTISVTIPSDFYYLMDDGTKVYYGGVGKSFDYKIDETTLTKAEVTFDATDSSGTTEPPADTTVNYSLGQEVNISFAPAQGFDFKGWLITGADGAEVDETKIKIADKTALSTKLYVYEAVTGITVKARACEILSVQSTTPAQDDVCAKDSQIDITFNHALDDECANLLNGIKVSIDGSNVDSYFATRTLSDNKKTITIKNTGYLSIPKNTTKTLTVTIPDSFYYKDLDDKIYLSNSYAFSYVVKSETTAKAKVSYKVIDGETNAVFANGIEAATINQSEYVEYNIGEEIPLVCDVNDGYKFVSWKVVNSSGNNVSSSVLSLGSSSASSTTLTVNSPIEGVTVKAVCCKRPVIAMNGTVPKISPYSQNDSNIFAKNEIITIEFDHAIQNGQQSLIEISYTGAGGVIPKDTYFTTSISSDLKTITLTPKQLLPVNSAVETVTVRVPKGIYYYCGSSKITMSDTSDYVWTYKIDNTTTSKTGVLFSIATSSSATSIDIDGTPTSTGTTKNYSLEQSVILQYPLAEGRKFSGWKLVLASGLSNYTLDKTGYVTSGEITVKQSGKTYFKLAVDSQDPTKAVITVNEAMGSSAWRVNVQAGDFLRPAVSYATPSSGTNYKDASIVINFNHALDADSVTSTYLKKIKIYSDGVPVDDYFKTRNVNDSKNVITISNTTYLPVEAGRTKTISVIVPKDFYYLQDSVKIEMAADYSFSYTINSTTSKKVSGTISCTSGAGTLNTSGTFSYNIGDVVDLNFTLNAGYKFTGWTVTNFSGGAIGEGYLKIEDKNSLSTKLYVYNQVTGVKITANAVLVPQVDSITPAYAAGGVYCDTPIVIKFSKPMNPDYFDDFEYIKIYKNGTQDISLSFKEPSLSEDKKTLTLRPEGSEIGALLGDLNRIDVTIKLAAEIKDNTNELTLADKYGENGYIQTIRYNNVRESDAPVLDSDCINIYRDEDENFEFDKKDFANWTSNSDYQNHAAKSLWIYTDIVDAGSGVKGLKIKETLIKKTDDTDCSVVAAIPEGTTYGSFEEWETYRYQTFYEYEFLTQEDGIIKIEISAIDYAGNETEDTYTYYFVKDTKYDISECYLYNELPSSLTIRTSGSSSSTVNPPNEYSVSVSSINETIKKMYICVQDDVLGKYKGSERKLSKDTVSIQVWTKASYNGTYTELSNSSVTKEGNLYIFTYNGFSTLNNTYIKVVFTDAAGNSAYKEFEVPRTAKVEAAYPLNDNGKYTFVYKINEDNYRMADRTFNYSFLAYNATTNSLIAQSTAKNTTCTKGENRPYTGHVDNYSRTYPWSSAYINMYATLNACQCIENKTESNTTYQIFGQIGRYEQILKCKALQKDTSKVKKPTLNVTSTTGGVNSSAVNVTLNVSNLDLNAFYIVLDTHGSDPEPTFNTYWSYYYINPKTGSLWSDYADRTFKFKVLAVRWYSDGNCYYNESDIKTVSYNYDNVAPWFDYYPVYSGVGQKVWLDEVQDNTNGVGLKWYWYNQAYKATDIKYWIMPYPGSYHLGGRYNTPYFSESDILASGAKEHIATMKITDDRVPIDIGGLDEGLYVLCVRIEDAAGNYVMRDAFTFNVGTIPDSEFNLWVNGDEVTAGNICEPNDDLYESAGYYDDDYHEGEHAHLCFEWEYFDTTNKCWVKPDNNNDVDLNDLWDDMGGAHSYTFVPKDNSGTKLSTKSTFIRGHYYYEANFDWDPESFKERYSSYNQYIITEDANNFCWYKNVAFLGDEVAMVKSDKICIVETAVSSINYDTLEDWDKYASKHNPELADDSTGYNYFLPMDKIDSGDYYCVLVHFADGTSAMTSVKQK